MWARSCCVGARCTYERYSRDCERVCTGFANGTRIYGRLSTRRDWVLEGLGEGLLRKRAERQREGFEDGKTRAAHRSRSAQSARRRLGARRTAIATERVVSERKRPNENGHFHCPPRRRHCLCLAIPLPSAAKTLPAFALWFHRLRGGDAAFALRFR